MWRRRSPSVMMPTSLPSPSTTPTQPKRLARHRPGSPRDIAVLGRDQRQLVAVCMMSATRSSWLPSLPPGWKTRKSLGGEAAPLEQRHGERIAQRQHQVVEVVGARPIGQASRRCGQDQRHVGGLGQRRCARGR